MDYKMIENKVKEFCESQYEEAEKYCGSRESIINKRAMCYGVVHFATNYLFPQFHYRLGDWWNYEMRNKFQKLIEKNS